MNYHICFRSRILNLDGIVLHYWIITFLSFSRTFFVQSFDSYKAHYNKNLQQKQWKTPTESVLQNVFTRGFLQWNPL